MLSPILNSRKELLRSERSELKIRPKHWSLGIVYQFYFSVLQLSIPEGRIFISFKQLTRLFVTEQIFFLIDIADTVNNILSVLQNIV